jgi:hypothetical protein
MRIEYVNVNTNKLHDELITADINPVLVESLDEKTWITYADGTDMTAVQAVIDAHDPTPLPPEPTVQERIEALEAALLEVILGG